MIAWQHGTDCLEPHPEDSPRKETSAQKKTQFNERHLKCDDFGGAWRQNCGSLNGLMNNWYQREFSRAPVEKFLRDKETLFTCQRRAVKRLCRHERTCKGGSTQSKVGHYELNAKRKKCTLTGESIPSDNEVAESCAQCLARTPAWAKSPESRLAPLWLGKCSQSDSGGLSLESQFAAERHFNERVGLFEPHCAICSYFWQPECRADVVTGVKPPSRRQPQLRTSMWLSELIFAKGDSFSLEEECGPGSSQVLRCASCLVTVHSQCYGVQELDLASDWCSSDSLDGFPWYCDRCGATPDVELRDSLPKLSARCALCLMRGGALKRCFQEHDYETEDEEVMWCHITCAVAIPKVRFGHTRLRSPILLPRSVSSANVAGCCVCGGQCSPWCGVLAKCSYSKCKTFFHPTCAYFDGVLLEVSVVSHSVKSEARESFSEIDICTPAVCDDLKDGMCGNSDEHVSWFRSVSFTH